MSTYEVNCYTCVKTLWRGDEPPDDAQAIITDHADNTPCPLSTCPQTTEALNNTPEKKHERLLARIDALETATAAITTRSARVAVVTLPALPIGVTDIPATFTPPLPTDQYAVHALVEAVDVVTAGHIKPGTLTTTGCTIRVHTTLAVVAGGKLHITATPA